MKKLEEQLLGAHTSIAGGVSNSVDLATSLNFTAMQVFSKNNNRWTAPPPNKDDAKKFREKISASRIRFVIIHDSYLINLCAKSSENLKKSREAFLDEIKRAEFYGINYLNFHPGAHLGQGEEEGIKIIAESLNLVHSETPDSPVYSVLETTAGQGTNLGYSFEQLRKIIDLVDEKKRMKVCVDTAHIFAAGYDIKSEKGYEETIKNFDEILGLKNLVCFHMNDSKKELGSKVDRHEHIGKGFIGRKGFYNIMNDERLWNIPKILETPKGKEMEEDKINLKYLKNLIESK